jgi:hypothetical protein
MAEVNRAVFQIALDLNLTVFTELERAPPISLAKNRLVNGFNVEIAFATLNLK